MKKVTESVTNRMLNQVQEDYLNIANELNCVLIWFKY